MGVCCLNCQNFKRSFEIKTWNRGFRHDEITNQCYICTKKPERNQTVRTVTKKRCKNFLAIDDKGLTPFLVATRS